MPMAQDKAGGGDIFVSGIYADIIVDISHEKVDRPFQYKIPQALRNIICPGMRVHVPFGRGNQDKVGYVVDITNETEYPADKIK